MDDNNVLKEQLGILTYVQVWRIIKLKVYSKLTILKAFVDKVTVSDSDGSESGDYKGSSSKGSNYGHDTSASGDSSDSGVLILKSSSSGSHSITIEDISCQHQTKGKIQLESRSARLKKR